MRRYVAVFLIFLILSLGGFWVYKQFMRPPRRPSLWQNIPAGYLLLAYTPSFSHFWRTLQHSPIATYLRTSPHLGNFFALGYQWDSLLHHDAAISEWLAGHALLVAVYPEGSLYLIEAPFLEKVKDWRGEMESLAARRGWEVQLTQTAGGYALWKLREGYLVPAGRILAYSKNPELLVRFLLGENIAQLPPQWGKTLLEERGELILHTSGSALQTLLPHPILHHVLPLIDTTEVEVRLTEESLNLKARANSSSALWKYLGPASAAISDLCPPSTTAFFTFHIQKYDTFFEAHLRPSYRDEIHQTEQALSLSFGKGFASKLSGETGLVQGNGSFILYRLKSSESPPSLPTITARTYEGYQIYQVKVGKLFRWLYGEGFGDWEAPYMVQAGEWVLFSRNEAPLHEWIEAFLSRRSLYNRSDFPGLTGGKALLIGYLDCQSPKWVSEWLPPSAAVRWREELRPFHHIEVSLERSDSLHLQIELKATWKPPENSESPPLDTLTLPSPLQLSLPTVKDTSKDGPQEEYYPNGVVKRRFTLIDAQLEGEYTEYHPNGMIKVQGFYEQGQKVGKWQYFNSKGVLIREEIWGGGDFTSNPNAP
ncbi:MAG: hypothetical protein N2253_07170 [Bacteroidia bacterium]|nr:hypothetical protein [Bacteroidia bacterium]MDW8056770.1 hypothetical protein [Bacteroidia bacterium]